MRFSRFLLWPAGIVVACLGMQALAQPAAAPQAAPQADVISNPFANDPAAPAAGKAVFESTCAACHGAGAAGTTAFSRTHGEYPGLLTVTRYVPEW